MKFSALWNNTNPGTDAFFNRLRRKEYSRLDKGGHVYLDYTGGNIYPQSLLDKHFRQLQQAVYGNPHSVNPASLLSEKYIAIARKKVLDFFNAPDYYCIFTHNASGALRIIGECYPFSAESHLLLTVDNHNSVNGIREYCRSKGAGFTYSAVDREELSVIEPELINNLHAHSDKKNKLFAYPAQSNVSGIQHSLSWITLAREQGWDVLLDAAAFVPGSKLDLTVQQPDFVSLSFYKIFGYPTGIGCLLVKKSKFYILKKPWFSGGTITLSAVKYQGHFLKQDHEKFEDGTVNYLDIPAIANGLDFISSIGITNINCRIKELGQVILSSLEALKHSNGLPLVMLYGPKTTENRGGTYLMNFFDVQGKCYPLKYIEEQATAHNISLRTGCFCNPGIDEMNHSLTAEQLRNYFTGRDQGDYFDFISFLQKTRGSVRLSVGIPTTRADIKKFTAFAKKMLNKQVPPEVQASFETGSRSNRLSVDKEPVLQSASLHPDLLPGGLLRKRFY